METCENVCRPHKDTAQHATLCAHERPQKTLQRGGGQAFDAIKGPRNWSECWMEWDLRRGTVASHHRGVWGYAERWNLWIFAHFKRIRWLSDKEQTYQIQLRREALATMICSYLSRTFCLLFAYFKADMKSLVRFCDVCVDWLGDIASSSVNLLGEGIVPLVLCLCLCSVISLKQFLILFLFLWKLLRVMQFKFKIWYIP